MPGCGSGNVSFPAGIQGEQGPQGPAGTNGIVLLKNEYADYFNKTGVIGSEDELTSDGTGAGNTLKYSLPSNILIVEGDMIEIEHGFYLPGETPAGYQYELYFGTTVVASFGFVGRKQPQKVIVKVKITRNIVNYSYFQSEIIYCGDSDYQKNDFCFGCTEDLSTSINIIPKYTTTVGAASELISKYLRVTKYKI